MQQNNWIFPPDFLELESHHVDVWRIPLNLTVASVKLLFSCLSADEAQRAIRFHFPADRDRFIAAHGILRKILGRYHYCKTDDLVFSVNQYGKPILVNSNLEFNLSHSSGFALLAVTQARKIGVDVERVRTDLELENIASRNFSEVEVSELMALSPKQREIGFFNCWTRKEAYIKAHGLGLSLSLDSFDVSLLPDPPAILRATRPDPKEAARWTLCPLSVAPNYSGALAVEGLNLDFRFWDWNPTFLV